MLYTNASWEKMHTGLYKHGDQIIGHKLSFFASPVPLLFGGVFIAIAVMNLGAQYLNQAFSLKNLQPLDFFLIAGAVCSIWLIRKGMAGREMSKERGGIHPNDTLIILDSTTQTVIKQVNMTEEPLGMFTNMQINIRKDKSGKNTSYRIEVIFPDKKERIATTNNKAQAEKLLQDIKTHLNIT